MRNVTFLLFAVALLLCCSFTTLNRKPAGIRTIVIDAGHGGHDPGCNYGGKKEKNITLAIALKLGKIIKENLKDVNIVYTRKDDKFIELWERASIANRHNADIFVSIHVNSNNKTHVKGTETFTMGPHKSVENLDVAKRENAVVLMENNYTKRYDGFDPKSPEANIIFSLFQDAHLHQSLRLASKVEKQLGKSRNSRGVKQAGFLVLWKTTMPSVLIETGFLSNAEERKFLTSPTGQYFLANGIYKALKEYKSEMETTSK